MTCATGQLIMGLATELKQVPVGSTGQQCSEFVENTIFDQGVKSIPTTVVGLGRLSNNNRNRSPEFPSPLQRSEWGAVEVDFQLNLVETISPAISDFSIAANFIDTSYSSLEGFSIEPDMITRASPDTSGVAVIGQASTLPLTSAILIELEDSALLSPFAKSPYKEGLASTTSTTEQKSSMPIGQHQSTRFKL
eukprot:Gb_11465 [translate_table: standard]